MCLLLFQCCWEFLQLLLVTAAPSLGSSLHSIFSTLFTHRKIVFPEKNASCQSALNISSKLPYRFVIIFLKENAFCQSTLNISWKLPYRFIHVFAIFDVCVMQEFWCSVVQSSIATDSIDKIILSYLFWQVMIGYRHIVTRQFKQSPSLSNNYFAYTIHLIKFWFPGVTQYTYLFI